VKKMDVNPGESLVRFDCPGVLIVLSFALLSCITAKRQMKTMQETCAENLKVYLRKKRRVL
jgi:hypothetical protein